MNGSPDAFDQPRALAAQRLGQQKPRRVWRVERRRMKLHELHVGDARARAIGQRDAVAGRHRRIGRLAEHLPGAAGRQQRRRARTRARLSLLVDEPHAGTAAVLDDRAR